MPGCRDRAKISAVRGRRRTQYRRRRDANHELRAAPVGMLTPYRAERRLQREHPRDRKRHLRAFRDHDLAVRPRVPRQFDRPQCRIEWFAFTSDASVGRAPAMTGEIIANPKKIDFGAPTGQPLEQAGIANKIAPFDWMQVRGLRHCRTSTRRRYGGTASSATSRNASARVWPRPVAIIYVRRRAPDPRRAPGRTHPRHRREK